MTKRSDDLIETGKEAQSVVASFRDPAGRLCRIGDRIIRIVENSAAPNLVAFLSSKAATQLTSSGSLVRSSYLPDTEARDLLAQLNAHSAEGKATVLVEHERIAFPSFPYEWAPEMLAFAGDLTLQIAEMVLDEGFGLKDATPYNVLFQGARPIFIDVLSFEYRQRNDPIWLPYAQFIRTFVLPLLIYRTCGLAPSLYLADRRDGIEPGEAYRLLSFKAKLRSPALTHVTLPAWLAKLHNPSKTRIYQKKSSASVAQSDFVLRSTLRSLRRSLGSVSTHGKQQSAWADYVETHSYSADAFENKGQFVDQALNECRANWLLDVGCNTGTFSVAAAKNGVRVVALDSDPLVVGRLWRKAYQENLDILPLVVNIARPTPATGWRNEEYPSFLERCRHKFDVVLMLAVIHHMMATEGIPLSEVLHLASDLTRKFLIIEYVDPADPMFQRLIRGRVMLFEHLNRTTFELESERFFKIVRSQALGPTRSIYVMAKKDIR